MANTTLISVPSEIDKTKLKKAVSDALAPVKTGDEKAAKEALHKMTEQIHQGAFGPSTVKPTFDINVVIGGEIGDRPDWHVNFTWRW
jgi:hypothetical protein